MRNKIFATLMLGGLLGLLLYAGCKRNDNAIKPSALPTGTNKTVDWTSGSAIVNGTYEITNVASGSNNYALSFVPNGTNPQLMVQTTYNALTNNQRYTVTSVGTGLYKVINVATGKALAALNTSTGWQLQLMPYSSTDTKQQWQISYIAAAGGTSAGYQMVNKANTALCATAASTANYAHILNNTILTSSANSQRWSFAQVAYQDSTVTTFFQRTSGSEAFDGNFSIPLKNGQVVWFTNDVYYNQLSGGFLPCLFNYHNSVMVQPTAQNWTASSTTNWTASGDPNVPTGSPALFWDLNTSRYIWPGAGIQIGNFVYAYCNEIQNVSGGFSVTGAYLANLNLSSHQVNYQSLPALDSINFGIGMIKNSHYVYVYGYKNAGLGANVYVARFDTTATATWTFFAGGTTWSSSASSAVSIGQAASAGADVAMIDGKYVMISTAFNTNTGTCDNVTSIFSNFSTSLTGPFSSLKVIYNITDRKSGFTPYFYTPVIHPQATITGSNEFLFTYCVNGYAPCLVDCNSNQLDPNVYRPRGVRVPYSVVDPSL